MLNHVDIKGCLLQVLLHDLIYHLAPCINSMRTRGRDLDLEGASLRDPQPQFAELNQKSQSRCRNKQPIHGRASLSIVHGGKSMSISKASKELQYSPLRNDSKLKAEDRTGIKSTPDKHDLASPEDKTMQLQTKLFQKTKKIEKQSSKMSAAEEYRLFYKHHYSKLIIEHPSWNPHKITTVVSLLWKKLKQLKRTASEKQIEEICQKIGSGREAFKDSKVAEGNEEQQIQEMWKRLPLECKRRWQKEGDKTRRVKKVTLTNKLRCSEMKQCSNPLSVMMHRA